MIELLLTATLLVSAQAAPQVPQKNAVVPAQTSRNIQDQSNNNKTTTPSTPSLANQEQPVPPNGHGEAQNSENSKTNFGTPNISVTIGRNVVGDSLAWVFDGLLVVVGFLQCLVLWRQAKIMGTHAEHLENLAIAAKANSESTHLNAQALETANSQSAKFFQIQNRPWVGMSKELTLLEKKSAKPGQYEFTVRYTVKNFGSAPAFNTIVVLGATIADVNNYELVKSKVAEARKNGENIVKMTGDLLLPGVEKGDTYHFGESVRPDKIVIPGCIVYRFADDTLRYTELSYWVDFAEGEKATFRTLWFQDAN